MAVKAAGERGPQAAQQSRAQSRAVTRAVASAALLFAVTAQASDASAQICSSRKISATGATAQFALLGKVAARTAWSQKVSADPRLGSRYGTWLRGKDRRIVCRKVERRHICLAIALPCRASGWIGPAAAQPSPDPKRRPL